MENLLPKARQIEFHWLKLAKKQELTKSTFALEFEIPPELSSQYQFEAGQYVTLQLKSDGNHLHKDFSMTSAPYEGKITLGIKINSEESFAYTLFKDLQIGDQLEVSEPRGRFTIISKPHEFRTIVGFAGGIGITPIVSHFKNFYILNPELDYFFFTAIKRGSKSSLKMN